MQAVIDSTPDVIFDKDLVGVYRASDNAWGWLVVGVCRDITKRTAV
jgi:hypothetical protein